MPVGIEGVGMARTVLTQPEYRLQVVRQCTRPVDRDSIPVLPSNEYSRHLSRCNFPHSESSVLHRTASLNTNIVRHHKLGTLFGALYGLVGQKIAGTNPYALVAVMTFQAFFTNYLIVFAPRYQGVGIVG